MRVLNFGSLNRDRVYRTSRIVRPGETLAAREQRFFCGGKGLNQSLALARAGTPVCHAGCIGPDGEDCLKVLQQAGVDTHFVRSVQTPTGSALIQVDDIGQNAILLFAGANAAVDRQQIDQTLEAFDAGDWLLLQNESSGLCDLLEQGARKGMTLILNPSPFDPALTKLPLVHVSCFLLNEIEGAGLTGESQPLAMMDNLRRQFPNARFVLTLGADGAYYFDGRALYYEAAYPVDVVDTTAAGDTFAGYFLDGLRRGLPPPELLRRACCAAGLAVSRPGAASSIPEAWDVEKALRSSSSPTLADRMV